MNKYFLFCLLFLSLPVYADFSGEYYASLKKQEVNWRSGPGKKYPIKWIYQEAGYPVRVLDAYDIWRQVQEADGSIGWVHKNMLSTRRTVLIREEGNLINKPQTTAQTIAIVQPGTIGQIERCPASTNYCLLSFQYNNSDVKGWFPRSYVWGIDTNEEID